MFSTTAPQPVSPVPLPDGLLEVIDNRKPTAVEHRDRGMAALQREDWKLAAEEFQAALDTDSERDELRYGLAMARFRLQEWGAATTLLNRILNRHPNDPAALELLGIVELFQRRHSAAIRHLTQSLAAGRKGPLVHSMLARAHYENGDPEDAWVDTERAIEAGSQDYGVYLLRCAVAIQLKRKEAAGEAFQTAERLGAPSKSLESLKTGLDSLPP